MTRLTAIVGVALALSLGACSSSPSHSGAVAGAGSGGSPTGTTGGSAAVTTGGSSGGDPGRGGAGSPSSGGVAGTAGSADGARGGSAGESAGASGNGAGASGGPSSGGSQAGGAASSGGSSGAAAGGSAGSGGGAAVAGSAGSAGASTLPVFVTSAPNAYWNVQGMVTTVTSGSANLTVDSNTKYQKFTGFGGCFNEMGWDALSVLDAAEVTKALKLLFDANDGANFAYGRLPMGASDYSMSWYTLDETAGDYAMNDFSIARDREKLIPYIKAALAVKPDIKLWASPWVVPSWMMDASNMKSDAQTLGAHALYMSRFVEEYAKESLKLVAIHPQNEPGYARVHWTQAALIDFVKTYLGPTFAQRNISAEIWFGTMSKDPDDTNIAKAAANDAEAMKYIKGFGVQWNLQAAVATFAQKAPVMQTEHKCGNYNFMTPYWDQSRYDAKKPQNDHAYGEESWQLIRDWIVSGVSSYSAWNMVLDTLGVSLDNWPQNALLTVDRSAKKLIVTPAYYVFRHFSQYIQPNATRIGVSGSTDALAFLNPDGSIVTEVYNKGESVKKTTLAIGAALYEFDVPAHGWATLRTAQ
jgi:glucosylceramidase